MTAAGPPVLEIGDLHATFTASDPPMRAVRGVDLSVGAGETVAIVGESGSGKTTLLLSALGLVPRSVGCTTAASIRFEGSERTVHGKDRLGAALGDRIGMIFQDPQSSMNPTMRVGAQVGEGLRVHRRLARSEVRARVLAALEETGVPDPVRCARSYPHQLSGGMRQRAMIAMATIAHPSLLVADEPTTALDVTLQAQIVDLLVERQHASGMAVVFVTHDLSLVSGFADRTIVMYAGQVVEEQPTEELVARPVHPYTRALLDAVPSLDGRAIRPIPGRPANPRSLPSGCAFAPRCAHATAQCDIEPPPPSGRAHARCWLAAEPPRPQEVTIGGS